MEALYCAFIASAHLIIRPPFPFYIVASIASSFWTRKDGSSSMVVGGD